MKRLQSVCILGVGLLVGLAAGTLVTTAHGDVQTVNYDQVVGRVGETTVTRGQLAELAISTHGLSILDRELHDRAYIEEVARRRGITVTPAEVSARTQEYRRLLEMFDQFTDILGSRNVLNSIPPAVIEDGMRLTLLAEKVMGINISPQDADDWYNNNREKFFRPRLYRLILTIADDPTTAKEAVRRIRGGADARTVASQLTNDDIIKARKGELPWLSRTTASQPQYDAVFKADGGKGLAKGKCTEPIPVQNPDKGKLEYWVFYVDDILESWTPTKAEVMPAVQFLARTEAVRERQTSWVKEQEKDIPWMRVTNLRDPNATPEVITPRQ